MSDTLKHNEFYDLGDHLPYADRQRLKVGMTSGPLPSFGFSATTVIMSRTPNSKVCVMAKMTGEKRAPRQGEWYFSGATILAYRAPNKLSVAYHIAKLVKVKVEQVTTMVEV